NASNVGAATTVALATTSPGGTFYSDSGCTAAVASVSVAGGSNSQSFYWKDTKSGTPTLTASTAGMTSATQGQTVNPAAASKLVYLSAAQSLVAGTCSAVVNVQTQDPFSNPSNVAAATAVNLTST